MNRLLRKFRLLLSGGSSRPAGVFRAQSRACEVAFLLVNVFYAANLLLAGLRLANRKQWSSYESLDPLWPLFWAGGLDADTVAVGIFTANALVAAIAALVPTNRVARWLAFAGVFLAGAFENSFGRIGHSEHAWVWVSLFFAFLPSGSFQQLAASRVARQRFLQIFWSAQFAVLFFYSMSGWLKLVAVPVQLVQGEVCSLAPEALARHVANRALLTQSQPPLAEAVIDHLWLSWPLFIGALYLEASAVLIAFRPALHRLWGAGLILLHLGIGMAMAIWFVPPMFILALLLVNSPFHVESMSWRAVIWQMPGMELFKLTSSCSRISQTLGVAPAFDRHNPHTNYNN